MRYSPTHTHIIKTRGNKRETERFKNVMSFTGDLSIFFLGGSVHPLTFALTTPWHVLHHKLRVERRLKMSDTDHSAADSSEDEDYVPG